MLFRALMLATLLGAAWPQDRLTDEFGGEYKGFARASPEQITPYSTVPRLRTVTGRIEAESSAEELPNVLFEIRGPGASRSVRGSRTNVKGEFTIRNVRPGEYTFKTTRDGFRSIVGHLIVTKAADQRETLGLKLALSF